MIHAYRAVTTAAAAVALFIGFAFATPAQAAPAFSFTKAFTPATIGAGSSSKLSFRISNSSGSDISAVAFTDDLPAGVTIAAVPGATSDCGGSIGASAGDSTITFTGGSIANTIICHLSVNVTSATPGVHSNSTSTLTWNGGSWPAATADLTVDPTYPGLSKSFSPSTVLVGHVSTLAFSIENPAAGATLTTVQIADSLPSGLNFANPVNSQSNCPSQIPPGTTCTLSVDTVPTYAGEFDNVSQDLVFSTASVSQVHAGFASAALQAATLTQIPTLNFWALTVLAGLLLLSAGWFLRR